MRRINHNQMLYEHEIQYKMYKVCKKHSHLSRLYVHCTMQQYFLCIIPWIFFLYLHSRRLFFSQMAYTQHQQQQSQLGIVLRFIFFGRRRLMMAHSSRAQIFFHANYFFGKKHIYFLATDLDRRGILWPPYVCSKQPNRFR